MAVQIQFRNDTAANWTSADPILALGELGLETDTDQIKIGNGVDSWADLAYGGIVGPEGPTGPVSTVPGPQGETGPQGAEKFSGFLLMGS
jgi:hypothetical protein